MTTEGLEVFERALALIFTWCIIFFVGVGVGRCTKEDNTTRPVEEIIKADSIIKVNDSIKIKVEQLDSIKDAKIIEVQTLDNDSTLKLFYELISK
jgi:uncharacterized protein YgfB (UPF0149 family)